MTVLNRWLCSPFFQHLQLERICHQFVIVAAEEFVKFEDLDRYRQLGETSTEAGNQSQNFFGLVGGRYSSWGPQKNPGETDLGRGFPWSLPIPGHFGRSNRRSIAGSIAREFSIAEFHPRKFGPMVSWEGFVYAFLFGGRKPRIREKPRYSGWFVPFCSRNASHALDSWDVLDFRCIYWFLYGCHGSQAKAL